MTDYVGRVWLLMVDDGAGRCANKMMDGVLRRCMMMYGDGRRRLMMMYDG